MFSRGKLIDTSYKDGIFTASGISNGAYHSSLGLKTLQRILSLITPDLAVVFDYISFVPSSPVTRFATLFNNIDVPFTPHQLHLPSYTLNGLKVSHGNVTFYAVWLNGLFPSPKVNLTYEVYNSNGRGVNDSIANVTFDHGGDEERNLFLFFTNNIDVIDLTFKHNNDSTTTITVDYLNVRSKKMFTVKQTLRKEKDLYVITSLQNKNIINNVEEPKSTSLPKANTVTLDSAHLQSKKMTADQPVSQEEKASDVITLVQKNDNSIIAKGSKPTPQAETIHTNTVIQHDYTSRHAQEIKSTLQFEAYHAYTVMLLSACVMVFLIGLYRKRMLNRYGIFSCCSSFAGRKIILFIHTC